MSTLVIQLPEHPRLRARAADEAAPDPGRRREYVYVTSADGIEFEAQGEAGAALLPRRSQVIAVVREADVAWHRITLPKAPASRLRAALVGVIEDALLEDAESVHLAVAPLAVAGERAWVAAIDRAWLQDELEALQKGGVFVDRVVPMAWPDEPPIGHFHVSASGDPGAPGGTVLTWAHVDGVATVRLDGGLARALVPQPPPVTTRWTASPTAAVSSWFSLLDARLRYFFFSAALSLPFSGALAGAPGAAAATIGVGFGTGFPAFFMLPWKFLTA